MGKNKKTKKPGPGTAGRTYKTAIVCRNILAIVAIVFLAAILGIYVLRYIGKKQLAKDTVGSVAQMQMDSPRTEGQASGPAPYGPSAGASDAASMDGLRDIPAGAPLEGEGEGAANDQAQDTQNAQDIQPKEGRVFYNNKAYDFNRDILTFLVMGIDQRSQTVKEQTEGFNGGSADAIFLVVLDPHIKKMQVIAIDRNTMTDVDIYDYYGKYKETIKTQLCVQHGFGDGTRKSAAYMEKAVSNLLYGLPINGYCAINMGAIGKINDAVGGVDVTVLEDMSKWDRSLVKGERVHLEGKSAFLYVQRRDTSVFGSAEGRLERQRQYINAFAAQAKAKFQEDPSLPITLFQELQPYMTTDINVEKAAYLAGMAAGFDFQGTDIRKVEGKNVMGERYEEFYVNERAMYELILDIFYEEVQ